MWAENLVPHTEGRTLADHVGEQCAEENIWT